MNDKELFINRELSWLQFNERVLQEAGDQNTPLLERLKFLGIFSNNQDEFFRVRVATLSRMAKYNTRSPYEYLGVNPKKILEKIYSTVNFQKNCFAEIYNEIVDELKQEKIFLLDEKQLNKEQGEFVLKYFRKNVRPHLFPVLMNNITDFSMLKDYAIYLTVVMSNSKKKLSDELALIEISSESLNRFVELPAKKDEKCIILVDDVIRYCVKEIFSTFDYNDFSAYTIKFTRDAELDLDNDISKSFIELLSESINKRKEGSTVRFIYDKSMPENSIKLILKKLHINKYEHLVEGGRYHNFKDFMNFPRIDKPQLYFPKTEAIPNKQLGKYNSIFDAVAEKDVLLNFPYNSFQYIIDFLREASIDPKVKSVSMTIYRLASNSNIINALINAARNGKKVTVYMEIQARFDEEANITWANKLHEAGVKVIQGVPGLKVHSKLILVKRKEKNKTVLYANVSTGNFNENTSKVYSDLSLLTCNKNITLEVEKVFDQFEHNFKIHTYKHLWVSPNYMRTRFTTAINNEVRNVKKGLKGEIILKLNSVVDPDMVKKLIRASQSGVKIKLIIRGICTLIPGITDKTDNIDVISIVDKYLEHTRVFIFHNNGNENVLISSADMMTRNFDRRIEVACPIYDKELKEQIKEFINIQLRDNTKARKLTGDMFLTSNCYVERENNENEHRAQIETYEYVKKINK